MKILIVNKFLYPNGGSETYIFKIGEYLKSIGHEVQYFGMEHEGRCVGNSAEQYTQDMDFHNASIKDKLTYPLKTIYSGDAKRKMRIVLDAFHPDVVHLNNFNYQLTPSIIYAVKEYEKASNKKVRIVYTAHDYQLVCPNHMMYNAKEEICEECVGGRYISCAKNRCIHSSAAKSVIGALEGYFWKAKKAYKYIDTVICPTRFMKTKIDTNPLLAGKTMVLHNFIDDIPKKDVKKDNYVLYFGRFSKEKGIDTIINAKNINFICAGSGPLEEDISKHAHIKNVGFKSDTELEMLIRNAKCSVYPSIWYENCPFSVMESIMYGTPVVGADIGGIPELIDDGETGFLFESGNTDAFEKAINKIINDDSTAERLSRNCLKTDFYTTEKYCEKLISIYNGKYNG